jgi:hypothetical protein
MLLAITLSDFHATVTAPNGWTVTVTRMDEWLGEELAGRLRNYQVDLVGGGVWGFNIAT